MWGCPSVDRGLMWTLKATKLGVYWHHLVINMCSHPALPQFRRLTLEQLRWATVDGVNDCSWAINHVGMAQISYVQKDS